LFRFRLKVPTSGVYSDGENKGVALLLPAGAEISTEDDLVSCGADEPIQLVHVHWEGRDLCMFLVYLRARGERAQ
jgi:hypothetical protein